MSIFWPYIYVYIYMICHKPQLRAPPCPKIEFSAAAQISSDQFQRYAMGAATSAETPEEYLGAREGVAERWPNDG